MGRIDRHLEIAWNPNRGAQALTKCMTLMRRPSALCFHVARYKQEPPVDIHYKILQSCTYMDEAGERHRCVGGVAE